MEITTKEKEKITAAAEKYVERFDSQNMAAATLVGVSSATLSQVLNRNWSQISIKMWRILLTALSYNPEEEIIVQTKPFKMLQRLLEEAKDNQLTMGIIGDAGTGKDVGIRYFSSTQRNVYALTCREYWNRKWFLMDLLTKMGRPHLGMGIAEMMMEVNRQLLMKDDPIIILNEYDKLPDHVLSFFITMYNETEGRCAFIVIATNHLKKRIDRGVALNKKGYNEIFSRLGRRFIELPSPSPEDITSICVANGVKDRATIKEIILESDADLRRVKRMLHAIRSKKNKTQKPTDDNAA